MTPDNFLGLPEECSSFDAARVLILPIPFEATVSYGHGTVKGPKAIITASQQVELYDREYDREVALEYGVHTLPALKLSEKPAKAVKQIAEATEEAAQSGKLVVGLGGEHTISVGFGRGILRALDRPITIVQLDAHSDLRDEYEESSFSHACIARRLLEDERVEQLLQLGIRSVCPEEVAFARANPERVRVWYSEDVHANGWQAEFIRRIQGKQVYLTIDVDGLDPSIVAATGTPEPDGLTWREAMDILQTLVTHATVVAIDCVELAPIKTHHASDFAVAKLLYKAISYALVGMK
ncbi:MAG: agmatinase [Caldilineaceae bacterium]